MAEAFGLAVAGGPGAPAWEQRPGLHHCRLQTRQALEREAARYDRYAARLAADGVQLRHETAMGLLIEAYAKGGGALRSPGAPLTQLGKAARGLKRDWHARHPEVKERRRRERIIRRALERVEAAPRPWRVEPRRPATPDDSEAWRLWLNWQQGEAWLRTLTERPEWDERPEWGPKC